MLNEKVKITESADSYDLATFFLEFLILLNSLKKVEFRRKTNLIMIAAKIDEVSERYSTDEMFNSC